MLRLPKLRQHRSFQHEYSIPADLFFDGLSCSDPGTNASRPRKITLKNLTEACMKLKPQGCFYHKNYYPDNCKRTKCDSVIIDLTVKNGIFSWKYADERQEIDVEEYTPCGRGKLCSKGQCVEHSATFDYQLPDPQAGGIGLICQLNTSCLKMGGKLIVGDLAKKYTTCENRNCKKPVFPKTFVNEIALRFLACNNPFPIEMAPQCFTKLSIHPRNNRLANADFTPFVMYEFCKECTKKMDKKGCYPSEVLNATKPTLVPPKPWGLKCFAGASKKYKNGYCAGDFSCISLYKDSPDTFYMRPIQTC